MNKVTLMGRLVRDPETRYSQGANQTAISRYTLAVNRAFKREGEPDADFINCVAFGKRGEFAQKYLKKGTQIAISGRIQTGSYEKDGQKVYTTDIIVDEHFFCGSGATQNTEFTSTEDAAPKQFTNPTYEGKQKSMNDDFMPVDVEFDDGDLPF